MKNQDKLIKEQSTRKKKPSPKTQRRKYTQNQGKINHRLKKEPRFTDDLNSIQSQHVRKF